MLMLFSLTAMAETAPPWHSMQPVGQAQLNYMFWPVYEAQLFTDTGTYEFPDTRPFALNLEYLRSFTSGDLLAETQRQWQVIGINPMPSWLQQLGEILPDVNSGDHVTLYVDAEGSSTFYINDQVSGSIADAQFSRQFAAIWLSPRSTRPAFRNKLLGD